MTFSQEFALVFSGMNWITAICLLMGIILLIIEIFQPGFGFFGVTGVILLVVGIALRVFDEDQGNPVIQGIILVGITIIIVCIALVLMVWSMKKGWLSRTSFVQSTNAVASERSDGTKDFRDLVGKSGIVINDLRPSGTVEIDGINYDVVSNNVYITKGIEVEVIEVEGIKIVVKQIIK